MHAFLIFSAALGALAAPAPGGSNNAKNLDRYPNVRHGVANPNVYALANSNSNNPNNRNHNGNRISRMMKLRRRDDDSPPTADGKVAASPDPAPNSNNDQALVQRNPRFLPLDLAQDRTITFLALVPPPDLAQRNPRSLAPAQDRTITFLFLVPPLAQDQSRLRHQRTSLLPALPRHPAQHRPRHRPQRPRTFLLPALSRPGSCSGPSAQERPSSFPAPAPAPAPAPKNVPVPVPAPAPAHGPAVNGLPHTYPGPGKCKVVYPALRPPGAANTTAPIPAPAYPFPIALSAKNPPAEVGFSLPANASPGPCTLYMDLSSPAAQAVASHLGAGAGAPGAGAGAGAPGAGAGAGAPGAGAGAGAAAPGHGSGSAGVTVNVYALDGPAAGALVGTTRVAPGQGPTTVNSFACRPQMCYRMEVVGQSAHGAAGAGAAGGHGAGAGVVGHGGGQAGPEAIQFAQGNAAGMGLAIKYDNWSSAFYQARLGLSHCRTLRRVIYPLLAADQGRELGRALKEEWFTLYSDVLAKLATNQPSSPR
ncbi:hypothetical protein BT67DRAFT_433154 [Trichocladium antarcticum]|uniref:Uncharacterized protein n=1 Tax=Trichocladium antarcticum TaxID=1450529 RepID=A0AAN6ZF82_9PEZI|nr:hypothetical protein BT67DRAFT_433154 [Trichocladium antarcticum]